MKTQIDWQLVLSQCKSNVNKSIEPCRKTIREPQPNLGTGAGGDAMKPMDLAAETAIIDILTQASHFFYFDLVRSQGLRNSALNLKSVLWLLIRLMEVLILCMDYPFTPVQSLSPEKRTLNDVYAGMVADLAHDNNLHCFLKAKEPIETTKK